MIGLWGPQSLMSKNSPLDADFANIFFKPIAEYLNNPETSEIMVNAYNDIWVEDNLGLRKVPETFTPDALVSAVNSLAQYVGRPLIENVYSIDARMPDGSRVCIVLPPVSGSDPIFSIRKFKEIVSDLDFLVKKGSLTTEMVDLIDACVKIKKNMMVAGGTSSGKTTLLNLIAAKIPDHDRIITIEDSRELQLKQEHVLALEAKPPDKHGKGEFSIRQCLKSSLRLRPDRIVVGEIRGGEAFDLIQAMNTGHGGCMGTVHANTPTDTLRRLESLSLTADIDMPIVALRAMVASALDLVISPARLSDGSRRIIQIAEIGPLTEKGDYQTFDIARYVSTHRDKNTGKIQGYFEFTGHVPGFFEMFEAEGVDVPIEFFRKRVSGDVPEREIPKLLEKGYEIPGRSKPEPKIHSIKTELPSAPQEPVIKSLPIVQQTIPPEQIKEKPNLIAPVLGSNFVASTQDENLSANNFEEETIIQDDYTSASSSEEETITQDDYTSASNFEEEQLISETPFEEQTPQGDYALNNNTFGESLDQYSTKPADDSFVELAENNTSDFSENKVLEEIQEPQFIPQRKVAEEQQQPKTETPKRPSLLERLSKISENSNIIPVGEEFTEEKTAEYDNSQHAENLPEEEIINHFPEQVFEETPQDNKNEDQYQTSTDFSFDEEENIVQPQAQFSEPEPQMNESEHPQMADEKLPENKQHVVIAEILRRMRENRSNNT